MPHEIHPETPREGRLMNEVFDQFDIDQVTMACNHNGAPYGIEFGEMTLLSNSRLSLETAEFARDNGLYHEFHDACFKACFTDCHNIGDMEVLLGIAGNCGLDVASLAVALGDGRYTERVKAGSVEAKAAGVTAIPAFIIEGQPAIIGAVPEDRFREAFQKLQKN